MEGRQADSPEGLKTYTIGKVEEDRQVILGTYSLVPDLLLWPPLRAELEHLGRMVQPLPLRTFGGAGRLEGIGRI
jgi:hypothetical protein